MSRYHREHPDMEPDAATERLYERADRLRDEQLDRVWERALAREAAPWDEVDAFAVAKEHRIQAELQEETEKAPVSPMVASQPISGTNSHQRDSNAS